MSNAAGAVDFGTAWEREPGEIPPDRRYPAGAHPARPLQTGRDDPLLSATAGTLRSERHHRAQGGGAAGERKSSAHGARPRQGILRHAPRAGAQFRAAASPPLHPAGEPAPERRPRHSEGDHRRGRGGVRERHSAAGFRRRRQPAALSAEHHRRRGRRRISDQRPALRLRS